MTVQSFLDALNRSLDAGPVALDVGIGGGGREFCAWLARELNLGSERTGKHTQRGFEWEWSAGRLVDGASCPPEGEGQADLGFLRIDRADPKTGSAPLQIACPAEIASAFLSGRAADTSAVRTFISRFGALTSIADVDGWAQEVFSHHRPEYVRRVESLIRNSKSFRQHFRSLQQSGGSRLLDLARVIYLLAPEPMHLGDEWASIASASSSRIYSLADINCVLSEFPKLFLVNSRSEVPEVEATSPFVNLLFSGFVPGSSSEYADIFQWMSKRAVKSLMRTDSADSFISATLPMVATKGGCLPALLQDGALMLAADPVRLADYFERDPSIMVKPGAKAFLLHAHRLAPGRADRDAQMEFALRRMSLTAQANCIAAELPPRAWRAAWSSTSPPNVHRVLAEDAAGVLSISVLSSTSPFRAYAGLGNGRIRALWRDRSRLVDTGDGGSQAEIRGISAAKVADVDFVVTVGSDSVIRAFRIEDPDVNEHAALLWSKHTEHASPLTTVAIWAPPGGSPLVLSGGVSGTAWCHDLLTGAERQPLVADGAEIRSICPIETDDRSVAVVATVDGRIKFFDLANGREVVSGMLMPRGNSAEVASFTPSCMDAVREGDRIRVLVGCAMGELFEATWDGDHGLIISELELSRVPRSNVNEVLLVTSPGRLKRYIARSDGVWLRFDPDDAQPVKAFVGHAGPVMCQAVFVPPGDDEVVGLTGGSEGTVRIWRHVETVEESLAYQRLNRHRGAIRAVEVRADDDAVDVVTGGDDGNVRMWHGVDAQRGQIVSKHQRQVTRFLWLRTASGPKLIVGSADGTLRLATIGTTQEPARLLGIAHEGITELASSLTDGMFWSAGNDGGITRWDALAGVARGSQVVCQYGKVTAMATDSYGRVYVGGQDGSLSAVDPDSLEILTTRKFNSVVASVDHAPDLNLLVLGYANGHIATLMDIGHRTGDLPRNLYRHRLGAVAVKAIDLEGQAVILSIGRDRKLVVIDVHTRAILHEVNLEGFPTGLAASGNYVAVSTTAGATLFEFSDGRLSSLQ